jgi:hypothetical protein
MNFWKTARDPFSPLVAPLSESFGRLGALVFQPDATEKSYWADALLGMPTRIAGSAAGFETVLTRGRKNVFSNFLPRLRTRFRTKHKPRETGTLEFCALRQKLNHPKKTAARSQPG